MFSQITPVITDAAELSYAGTRIRCQAGLFRNNKQGTLEIYQASDLKFRPEGTSVAANFPVCQPPKNLQLTFSTSELLDFYLYVNDSLFVSQKLLPGQLNVVNTAAWGSPISVGGPGVSEAWLRMAFGKGQPFDDRTGPLYPQLVQPKLTEIEAGDLLEAAQRKMNRASHVETVRGGLQEGEASKARSDGRFVPAAYNYEISWSFPVKLVFVEDKSQGWESTSGTGFKTTRPMF